MPLPRSAAFRGAHPGATALALLVSIALTSSPGRAQSPSAASASAAASASTPADNAPDKRERQARAVEFHNEAKALYERGLYRRAIAKLEAALALDPEGKELIYNLALIHEKLAEADIAEGYYRRYVEMETEPKAREKAQVIVKRLEGAKQKLKDDIQERTSPSASPTASAVIVAPQAPVLRAVRVPSPMVFIIGGVAVAAVGVGIGFGVSALTMSPVDATTGPGAPVSELETRAHAAHTQAIVSDFALATSFVIGAAATVLYLLESRVPAPAVAPATAIVARPSRPSRPSGAVF